MIDHSVTQDIKIYSQDQWPEGISDGLILPCHQCGITPSLDYQVSDKAWEQVVPKSQRLGVVCLQCFLTLGGQPSDIKQIQVVGHGQTLVLVPIERYNYDMRINHDI